MRPSDLGIDTTTAMRDLLAARSLDDLAKPRLPRWPKSETDEWWRDAARSEVLRPWLMRHCATYLTRPASSKPRIDPVALPSRQRRAAGTDQLARQRRAARDRGVLRHHGQLPL
jgi:hypothetical protein